MGRTLIYDEPILKACPMCGEEKPYFNNLQVYCRECAEQRSKTQRDTYKKKRRSEPKPPKDTLKNKFVVKKKKASPIPERSIDEVVRIASVNHISYGKAVLLLEVGNG